MKYSVSIIVFVFFSILGTAQPVKEVMDKLVTAYAKQNKFNGSVLVIEKGKVLFEGGYGLRDAAAKATHDVDDIFQIGSVTKQFTAAIIMQLQEEGKLSVDDRLNKYFSGLPNGDNITIENLLTHTSGLYNYTNDEAIMNGDVTKHYSQEKMLTLFRNYKPDFSPGANWNYSNTGYQLLGYIVEKVTGKKYEKVVRERIFETLQMTQSGFDFTHLSSPKKSTGYFVLVDTTILKSPVVDSTIAFSAGAIYSSVRDLAKWERGITEGKLLKPSSWQKIYTPYKNKYGYGWMIDTLHGEKAYLHGGGIHGFSSYLLRIPEKELAIFLIDNASSTEVANIGNYLAAIVLNKPYTIPHERKEIALPLEELKEYEGEYELAPGFSIKVFLIENELKGQATGQSAFTLYGEAKDKFFIKVVDARITFSRNESGKIESLTLFQGGRELPGKKK